MALVRPRCSSRRGLASRPLPPRRATTATTDRPLRPMPRRLTAPSRRARAGTRASHASRGRTGRRWWSRRRRRLVGPRPRRRPPRHPGRAGPGDPRTGRARANRGRREGGLREEGPREEDPREASRPLRGLCQRLPRRRGVVRGSPGSRVMADIGSRATAPPGSRAVVEEAGAGEGPRGGATGGVGAEGEVSSSSRRWHEFHRKAFCNRRGTRRERTL